MLIVIDGAINTACNTIWCNGYLEGFQDSGGVQELVCDADEWLRVKSGQLCWARRTPIHICDKCCNSLWSFLVES